MRRMVGLEQLRAAVLVPAISMVLALPASAESLGLLPVKEEPYDSGWSFYLDNDIFSPTPRDRDYTGGLAMTFAGRRAAAWPVSLDPGLGWINRHLRVDEEEVGFRGVQLHALQVGAAAFTPGNIEVAAVIPEDRPYASLLFLANSRVTLNAEHPERATQSTLTVGLLGTSAIKSFQRWFHEATESEPPRGWDHQISDGGELTFRYSYAQQRLWGQGGGDGLRYELKRSWEGSVGFITEANMAVSARWGRINTPWWSFMPDRSEYFSQPSPGLGGPEAKGPRELYVWAGGKVRARPYNALLQGQFRSSDLSYDFGDIEPVLLEGWLGVTGQVADQYRLSWVLRYQTSEMRRGAGDHELLWASVFISRYF